MDLEDSFANQDHDVGEKQCRACLVLHSRNQVYSLDSKNLTVMDEGSEQTIAEIYHQCTQLLYAPDDVHPKWICQQCTERMIDFFQFRKMCIDSYNTFKLSAELKLENERVKVETVNVSEDAANDNIVPGDSVIIKEENDFEYDGIHMNDTIANTSTGNECISKNNIANSQSNGNEQNMTLRKRTNVGGSVPNSSEAYTEKNEDDDHENVGNDSEFNDFGDYDDDSSDGSSVSEEMPLTKRKRTTTHTVHKCSKPTAEKPKPSAYLFSCDKCPRKFFKDYRYNAHMRRHNGLKAYQCEHCDKEFQKYYTLMEHTAVTHSDKAKIDRRVYICDHDGCGKEYARKQTLRVHIKVVHMGEKLSKIAKICELCGKKFKDNESLVRHSYTHNNGITPYKCDICSKMLTTAKGLKEHKLRHTGVKNFICPTCGMPKTTKNELRMHMMYHKNVKYPCEMCSTVFTNKENMKRHVRVVHHGVRAYPCPHCDQSFGKSETLKNHVARHTGVKPHVCQICDKRFIQSVALRTHMKTHNKNKLN